VPTVDTVIPDTLEAVAREGARRMLERALDIEVDVFLGRLRYAPGGRETGYRNGHGRPREIGIGTWSVEVRPPRVADLPPGSEPFSSALLPKRRYLSQETQRLFARLYLEGLSSGDFEPAFRELLGEKAPLSASTILRLKATWEADYRAWRSRPIEAEFAYIWCDGLYLGAGLEAESSCVLVVIGARADGAKELLAIELGYRESTASWASVLRDLRDRGLSAPLLAIGDGALGLWAALAEVYPSTRHQRCWNHRVLNLLDKLPKRLWRETRRRLREIWSAPTRAACEQRRDELALWLHAAGQDQAAETLCRDWDSFTTFYDFPAEHWLHLRTSNAISVNRPWTEARARAA
jgi:transposase-like protein